MPPCYIFLGMIACAGCARTATSVDDPCAAGHCGVDTNHGGPPGVYPDASGAAEVDATASADATAESDATDDSIHDGAEPTRGHCCIDGTPAACLCTSGDECAFAIICSDGTCVDAGEICAEGGVGRD
jgi:hypothetical protein